MARKRKPVHTTSLTDAHGLEPFGPSSPTLPPTIVLYFDRDPNRRMILNWASMWGAKKSLAVLGITDRESFNKSPIDVDDRLGGEVLQSILDYKLTKKEEEFGEVPYPFIKMLQQFKVDRKEGEEPLPRKRTSIKSRKENKAKKPRVSRDGLTTIGEIATRLKIEPRDARKILRSKKISKPEAGWCWPEGEVDGIVKILSE